MTLFYTLIWPLPTGLLYEDSKVRLENNKKQVISLHFFAYLIKYK